MNEGLKILTCNLFSGAACSRMLTDLIVDQSIDIVCAQELSVRLAKVISEILPYGDMSHEQISRGNGIACRHEVSVGRISMPRRDGWYVKLSPQHWEKVSFPLEVVNVHIAGPHVWPYFPRQIRRSAQIDALMEYRERKSSVPHAILGDFNSSPIWPFYKKMAAKYVDCTTAARNSGQKVLPTWPYIPQVGIKGLIRIDHCFLWGLTANHVQTVEIRGSDHLGLLVDLNVAEPSIAVL
jgi:exonuclease III